MFGEQYEAYSAGTEPAGLSPYAVKVMAEIGVDISNQCSKSVDEFQGVEFDCVITLCDQARESCPVFLGSKQRLHQSFEDPAAVRGTEEQVLDAFRRSRDQISKWIAQTFAA
jgi:arsenate reductase